MDPQFYFAFAFLFLSLLVILFDRKYQMLRDMSTAGRKPYSFSRVQLAWWTVIIISAFIAILLETGTAPTFRGSTIILLGISAVTTASAKLTDLSDKNSPNVGMKNQNSPSEGFFLDILSDTNGVSVPRFQVVIFNLIFGIWFIYSVWNNLDNLHLGKMMMDAVIPDIAQNNLILIGLSSGTYAALKTTENK
jgi:hypothetical protein